MKTYRVCTYEVVGVIDGIERTNLVDIIEFQAPELASGRNVFHLLRDVEQSIEANSDAASGDLADESIPSDPMYGQRMDSADLGEN